jgi:hypothetical protein
MGKLIEMLEQESRERLSQQWDQYELNRFKNLVSLLSKLSFISIDSDDLAKSLIVRGGTSGDQKGVIATVTDNASIPPALKAIQEYIGNSEEASYAIKQYITGLPMDESSFIGIDNDVQEAIQIANQRQVGGTRFDYS